MKRLTLVSGNQVFPLEVAEKSGVLQVSLSGEPLAVGVNVGTLNGGGLSLIVGDRSYEAAVVFRDKQISVEIEGERYEFELDDGMLAGPGSGKGGQSGDYEVKAPMPGKVVKLLVSSGESVEAGQGVLLFEAMKMQNEIRSPIAGEVSELTVEEGQAVESKERLFVIKSG